MNAYFAALWVLWARFRAWYRPRPVEPESGKLLADVIIDAKVVAVYVQRAGLQQGSALALAIAKVETLEAPSWANDEVVALQTALGDAMHALSPITIDSLRGKSQPFSDTPSQFVQTLSFMVLMAVLAATTAFFTISFNEGNNIAAKIAAVQERGVQQEIVTIASRLAFAAKLGSIEYSDPEANARIAAHLDDMATLRQLDNEFKFQADNADSFLGTHASVLGLITQRKKQDETNSQAPALKGPAPAQVAMAGLGASPGTSTAPTLAAEKSETPVPPNERQLESPCTDKAYGEVAGRVATTELRDTGIGEMMWFNDTRSLGVTCALGLTYHLVNVPPFSAYAIDLGMIVNLYGLWILPALYGALGGLTFYLRRMLNPSLPNPHSIRIITRCLIASLAGILISSFWAPAIAKNEVFSNAGLNLFAIAFLAGYSIDVFFYLLDHFAQAARVNIAKFTTGTPGTGTPP